jgi:hypothetical protein
VVLQHPLTIEQLDALRNQLKQLRFELLDDGDKQQTDQIKSMIIDRIHYQEDAKFVFSEAFLYLR